MILYNFIIYYNFNNKNNFYNKKILNEKSSKDVNKNEYKKN